MRCCWSSREDVDHSCTPWFPAILVFKMRQVLFILFITLAVSALSTRSASASLVIADLTDDFSNSVNGVVTPGGTWTYLWNKPVGWTGGALTGPAIGDITTAPLSDVSNFALLLDAGSIWTADGNTVGNESNPDRFIRLGGSNGSSLALHPGAQAGFNVGAPGDVNGNQINAFDRYAIAAFTVNAPGRYLVTAGELWTTNINSNGVDVWAFATGQAPSLLGNSVGGSTATTPFNFNYATGPLNPGDSIFVAFGTNGNASSDGSRANFAIAIIPEPGTGLTMLGLLGLAALRRKRRVVEA